MLYEVHFRRRFRDPASVTTFADPHEALAYARECTSGPWYMLRIHETGSSEWLTQGQFDLRLNGDVMRRDEFWKR